MEIINYLQKYESQVVDLWNRCCTFDSIDVRKFRKQALFDDNFDPSLSWLALDGEKVVGYILATKRKFPYLERGTEPTRGALVRSVRILSICSTCRTPPV